MTKDNLMTRRHQARYEVLMKEHSIRQISLQDLMLAESATMNAFNSFV